MPRYELTKKAKQFLTLEIDGKDYNIPLMTCLKLKEVKKLIKVLTAPEVEQVEGIATFLSQYMGEEIVDEMTIEDMQEVFTIWKDANGIEDGPQLGES